MRKLSFVAVAVLALFAVTGCVRATTTTNAQLGVVGWQAKLEVVTPTKAPPPLVRNVLNTGIRTAVPVACPALAAQASPTYRGFISLTCDSIVKSNDPFTTVTQVLPALCAGSPPIGAAVFPQAAPAIVATCPVIVQLPAVLGLTQYVPLF